MLPRLRIIPGAAACAALALLAGCSSGGSFPRLDADRNGSGSRAEFDAFMKQEVFARVDANHDAKVALPEWQAVNPKVNAAKFRSVDRDRDGSITRPEADAAFDREGSLARLFARVDADGNGGLSRAEVSAFRAGLNQQPGATTIEKLSHAAKP
jgi:hypothetical protein